MARPECDILDRRENKGTTPCGPACKNYKFPHLETACELSEVYSVEKGKPCYIFNPTEPKPII